MFRIYKASAGSGKTTHLVAEYLSLCFNHQREFRHILAITFTNNATAEMKERIIQVLHQLSFTSDYTLLGNSEKAILQMVKEHLQEDKRADTVIREKARELLKNILHDYPLFSVSTIDSFFYRLTRAFALDLGLNLNFNLEIRQDEFFDQAIDIFLDSLTKPDSKSSFSISKQVLRIMEKNMEKTGKGDVRGELLEILKTIYNERSFLALKKLNEVDFETLEQYGEQLLKERNRLKQSIIDIAKRGDRLIKQCQIPVENFYQKGRGPYSWFAKVAENPGNCSGSYMQKAVEGRAFTSPPDLLPERDIQSLIDAYNEINTLSALYNFKNVFAQNIDSFLLLFDLKKIMDDIKEQDNLFYLSEINSTIYEEIKDDEAPYIYEKLGNKYAYFLIDEFQDTSNMQWKDLLPLIKNALSGEQLFGETGKASLFGDVKQAIYRFRNGDPSLFNTLSQQKGYQEEMEKKELMPGEFEKISLSVNYRSSCSIIDFNNRFFTFLKQLPGSDHKNVFTLSEEYYEDVKQETPCWNDRTGFVKIRFQKDDDAISYMDDEVLKAVEDALERGFDFQDIAILTKDNLNGNQYARMLSAKGYPVISAGSLLLVSSEKIRLLISTMKYLLNEQDEIAKLTILHYLSKNHQPGMTSPETISKIKNRDVFRQLLRSFEITIDESKLRSLPLYSLVKELIRVYHFDETADSFITNFLDVILDYSEKRNPGLSLFIDWWEHQQKSGKLAISSPKEMNAITVTSVHKSKGLQYPVVIFPLKKYKDSSPGKLFWYENPDYRENDTAIERSIPVIPVNLSASLEGTPLEEYYTKEKEWSALDNLNVLYVAHTRPAECMYIITGKKEKGNYSKFLHLFIEQGNEMFTPAEEGVYYFGDLQYRKKVNPEVIDQSVTLSRLYTSSFSPDDHYLLYPVFDKKSEKQEIGIEVHRYLASLHPFPVNEEEIASLSIPTDEQVQAVIKKLLRKIVNDDTLHPYFSEKAKILNEITIMDSEGVAHRPDRVAILDNAVMVIDYKTGKEDPRYEEQIERYVSLIKEMGYSNVQGKLIALDTE